MSHGSLKCSVKRGCDGGREEWTYGRKEEARNDSIVGYG